MGKVFRKAVLAVNQYQSGDGAVTVTSDRLKHWEGQFRKLTEAGYAIPMHWNHAAVDDFELLSPITMDSLSRRDTRGAHNTEGRMTDFRVSPDGQSAEITVEVLTPSAQEKVEANSVYVSPVIFPEFRDGHGNSYADVITSVDLVDYPVDHSQGPFLPTQEPSLMGCAIRMGLAPKYYQPDKVKRMDNIGDQPVAGPDDMNQAPDAGGDIVAQIVAALAQGGIVLPEGTDASNIVQAIQATMGGGQDQTPDTVASPDIQTMSLAKVRAAQTYAERYFRDGLTAKLNELRDSGRMSDEEYKAKTASVGVARLSLNSKGEAAPTELDKWIESRKPLPEGTFKTATFQAKASSKLARMSVAEPPSPKGHVPRERIEEIKQMING